MLHRLIMALLIACLAVPAAAMPVLHQGMARQTASAQPCHQAPAPSHHDRGEADRTGHDCIGCIASWPVLPATLAPAAMHGAVPRPALVRAMAQTRAGPDTPPPRP